MLGSRDSGASHHGSHHGDDDELHYGGDLPQATRDQLLATNQHFTRRCNTLDQRIQDLQIELGERIALVEENLNARFTRHEQAINVHFDAIADSLELLERSERLPNEARVVAASILPQQQCQHVQHNLGDDLDDHNLDAISDRAFYGNYHHYGPRRGYHQNRGICPLGCGFFGRHHDEGRHRENDG